MQIYLIDVKKTIFPIFLRIKKSFGLVFPEKNSPMYGNAEKKDVQSFRFLLCLCYFCERNRKNTINQMERLLFTVLMLLYQLSSMAQTTLFHTGDETGYPYRIPAIATAKNGDVIALTDIRPCGMDIGYGHVNIIQRVSKDNGQTWGPIETVLEGSGQGSDCGYGDACLVADRTHNELLLVCCSGNVPYWQSKIGKSQRIVATHAHLDKQSGVWVWNTPPIDHTAHVFEELLGNRANGLFMGSGRICQSRKVKKGKYYRVYGGLCTHIGNFVIYSDDFGRSWHVLGSPTTSPIPKGDEPKCEELPDGSVLLSSRKAYGRYFNIFRYTDVKQGNGHWGIPFASDEMEGGIKNESSATNGEVMLVDAIRKSDGRRTCVALQSIPAGPGRQNVTIYWKELRQEEDWSTPLRFARNWGGSYQVSHTGSAYSTMTLQKDKAIGFFYEEEPEFYQMIYRRLTLEEITDGRYSIK